MNLSRTWSNSGRLAPDLLKCISTVLLGVGVGIISTMYSPLFAFAGTLAFTILAVTLYISSHYRHISSATGETSLSVVAESPKSGFLFYLFYLSFFLSITIPKSGKTFSGVPITTANIFILLTLIFWIIQFVFSGKATTRIPLFRPINLFIMYGIAAVLLGFMNHNQRKFIILDFVVFIGFIPLYFLVCSVVRTRSQVRKIVWGLTISLFLVCMYGFLQTKLGFAKMAVPGITEQYGMIVYEGVGKWNIIEGGARKVYSTFQNGNIFGNHLATFIPFLGGILIGLPSSKKRTFFAGIFLLSCYVLILTYSRGALVAMFSGIIALAVLARKIRLKAIVVMILVFSVLFIFLRYYSGRSELVRYDIRRMTDNPDQFSAGRIQRVKYVLEHVYKFPVITKLLGRGFGSGLAFPRISGYVDNLYLTLLFKIGILGLVILLGTLLRLFLTLLALRARTEDLQIKGMINGGIAGLVASLIHNLADTLWLFPPLAANFWFLAGITVSIALIGSQRVESTSQMKGSLQQAKGKWQRVKGER